MTIHGYHAHVYFDDATVASAQALRGAAAEELRGRARVHGLIHRPIGPHPLPMFEIDIPAAEIDSIYAWLESRHGPHSILVHPITGDDLADHRDHPRWIGQPLPLDLDFLRNLGR